MFQGFGLEMMWGSMFFGTLNLIGMISVILMILTIWVAVIFLTVDRPIRIKHFLWLLIFAGLPFLYTGYVAKVTLNAPKVTINVPQSEAAIERSQRNEEIIIHTPPPRVEMLDGFRPLSGE
jgi:hypothetical protein